MVWHPGCRSRMISPYQPTVLDTVRRSMISPFQDRFTPPGTVHQPYIFTRYPYPWWSPAILSILFHMPISQPPYPYYIFRWSHRYSIDHLYQQSRRYAWPVDIDVHSSFISSRHRVEPIYRSDEFDVVILMRFHWWDVVDMIHIYIHAPRPDSKSIYHEFPTIHIIVTRTHIPSFTSKIYIYPFHHGSGPWDPMIPHQRRIREREKSTPCSRLYIFPEPIRIILYFRFEIRFDSESSGVPYLRFI